jgi:hypothetical protein
MMENGDPSCPLVLLSPRLDTQGQDGGQRTDGIAADNRRDGMIDTLMIDTLIACSGGNSMHLTMMTDVHGISF